MSDVSSEPQRLVKALGVVKQVKSAQRQAQVPSSLYVCKLVFCGAYNSCPVCLLNRS